MSDRLFCCAASALRRAAAWALIGCVGAAWANGAADSPKYQVPPQAIVDMVDAPPIPQTALSPSGEWLMLMERAALPSVADLALPEVRLAGLRINPRNNDQSRAQRWTTMKFVRLADRTERTVGGIPAGGRIVEALWAPDGKRVALSVARDHAIELMVVELHNGFTAKRVLERPLNSVFSRGFSWFNDSKSLLVWLVPAGRGVVPRERTVPTAPLVQENLGKRNAARTYQDLLKSPHDEALFEYYGTSEIARVSLDGKMAPIVSGLVRTALPSPDGRHVLVQTIKRPYSYTVPYTRFALKTEVRDAFEENIGAVVRTLSDLPLAEDEELDADAVRKGPRQYAWRSDAPAALTWLVATEARRNQGDILYMLAAPFDGEPQVLARLEMRFQAIYWGNDNVALIVEASRRSRRMAMWRVAPADPSRAAVKLFERSSEDRYGDPGTPLTESNGRGQRILNFTPDGHAIYLGGQGASPEGDRPFVDRFELDTKESRRLFRSESPYFDTPIAIFDASPGMPKLLVQRESVTEVPNIFVRDLASGAMAAITKYPTPKNPLAGVTKETLKYKRKDGVELSATLYLPPGYKRGDDPLPLVMWAYPREFRSAEATGQVSGSPYRYVRPAFSGPLPFLTQGYAVLDNPAMPIVAEGGREPNDSYLPQLIASAEAAVEEVVRRGVADRGKIAVGGHSYGAFMVANLLAHTKLFAAGIAESGAYNRTLTPFGFQAEERTYWKARDVYTQMSPFHFADQIKTPILLIHGEADSNTGTFPLQSERLYQALRGLGGTVRLVMLPYEDHGYRGRESVLHRLWESVRWLDKYVKNGERR